MHRQQCILAIFLIAAAFVVGCASDCTCKSPYSVDKRFRVGETYQLPTRHCEPLYVTLLEVAPDKAMARFRVRYEPLDAQPPVVADGWCNKDAPLIFAGSIIEFPASLVLRVDPDGATVGFGWP